MESTMHEKLIFTSIASALRAEDIAAFEQTSTELRAMIEVTRTWAGPEAANIDEAMREACPWKQGDYQEGFVVRMRATFGKAAVLQAFAVAKGFDPGHFLNDGTWSSLSSSLIWGGSHSFDNGSPLNVADVFYDSLRTIRSFAGHKGVIKNCAEVVHGNGRIRRLANQAKAGRLDIRSLIAQLEVCLVARFILDNSVVGASIDKVEWCDNFRHSSGIAYLSPSLTPSDYAPSAVYAPGSAPSIGSASSVGSAPSQEELLDINEQWEHENPETLATQQNAHSRRVSAARDSTSAQD